MLDRIVAPCYVCCGGIQMKNAQISRTAYNTAYNIDAKNNFVEALSFILEQLDEETSASIESRMLINFFEDFSDYIISE